MGILEELQRLKDAEDFFDYFGIDYDERVVKPYRLHILKKFSLYVKEIFESQKELDDEKLRIMLKEGLKKAYETFLTSNPIKERVFKVHKDTMPLRDDGKKV